MWTINLCQQDWTFSHMFRQWTWNLDRTAASKFYHTGAVTTVLNISTSSFLQLDHQIPLVFHLRGPKYIKNYWFPTSEGRFFTNLRRLIPPTFELSRGKLGQSNPKMPPELRNTASWEALHKRTTTSDQYRQRNRRFTTTPLQPKKLDPVQLTTLDKSNGIKPQQLVYRHINVRKIHTNLFYEHKIHEITLKLVKSSNFFKTLLNTVKRMLLTELPADFWTFRNGRPPFQSNSGHKKISISLELPPPSSSSQNQQIQWKQQIQQISTPQPTAS